MRVAEYLASLPEDRRAVVSAVRDAINAALPAGFEEGIQYGMIAWYVPHARYPSGYHANPKLPLPYANLAAQKSHFALYLMCVYGSPALRDWFTSEWAKTGKRLDMGKSCVRFKQLDDVPLDLVSRALARLSVDQWIDAYESSLAGSKRPAAAKKAPAKKAPAKKAPAKTAGARAPTSPVKAAATAASAPSARRAGSRPAGGVTKKRASKG